MCSLKLSTFVTLFSLIAFELLQFASKKPTHYVQTLLIEDRNLNIYYDKLEFKK